MPENRLGFTDRRKGPDILLKLITWISFIGWVLIVGVLAIISKAGPQTATFFDRLLETRIRGTWDYELMQYAFYLLIVMLVLGLTGLAMNSRRHRRKTDRYRLSLIIMTIFSLAGIILYLLTF